MALKASAVNAFISTSSLSVLYQSLRRKDRRSSPLRPSHTATRTVGVLYVQAAVTTSALSQGRNELRR